MERIAAQVMEASGLPLTVCGSGAELRGRLYDMHAQLAFMQAPKTQVMLTSYRPGSVKELLQQQGMEGVPIAKVVQGAAEPPGTQTVYMKGYVGQEPALFWAVALALEVLGGRLREPISEEMRRKHGGRITPSELDRRHRQSRRKGMLSLVVGLLLLPVLIPVWALSIAWYLLTLPWWLRKAYRVAKRHTPRAP